MSPVVSVIIPHHLNKNLDYLKLCLEGLSHTKGVEYESFLVSSSEMEWPEFPTTHYYWNPEMVSVASKMEWAVSRMHKDSKYILLLSDDVVVSQFAIADMVDAFQGRELIMNPMSNSDCRSIYEADLKLERVDNEGVAEQLNVYPDMELHDVDGWQRGIFYYPRGNRCLIGVPVLSFYCTMFPKSVWEKVGGLDPALELRFNDVDFCMRATQLGIARAVNFGAFAFHFGSRTIKSMPDVEAEKAKCEAHFKKKWNLP